MFDLLRKGQRHRFTTAILAKRSEFHAQAALLDEEKTEMRMEKLRTFAGLDRPGDLDQEGLHNFFQEVSAWVDG